MTLVIIGEALVLAGAAAASRSWLGWHWGQVIALSCLMLVNIGLALLMERRKRTEGKQEN